MNKSETIGALGAALAKAQAEIKPAAMNATNPFLKNKYADLGAVIAASRDALAKNGLSVAQPVIMTDNSIGVETVLMHSSGEWMSSVVTLPMGEERGKSAAQVAGSIITYLRRYSLAAMVGIYADEDTDGNATGAPKKEAPKKEAAPAEAEDITPESPCTPVNLVRMGIDKVDNTHHAGKLIELLKLGGMMLGPAVDRIDNYRKWKNLTNDTTVSAENAIAGAIPPEA